MRIAFIVLICIAIAPTAVAADFDHTYADWNKLLGTHVHWISNKTATQVDYTAIQNEQDRLNQATQALSRVPQSEFDTWSKAKQLSFLINAYNAFTIQLILTKYPDIESIKEIGGLFKSPWKIKFFSLLGKERHLDEIEHDLIRKPGVYDDPRIHAAVNCAAIGCPALRPEAYVADRLDAQLEDSMVRYLRDRDRNRYDDDTGKLVVGKIFDWYKTDFEQGYMGIASLKQFFKSHADALSYEPEGRRRIVAGEAKITFSKYDWGLNRRP